MNLCKEDGKGVSTVWRVTKEKGRGEGKQNAEISQGKTARGNRLALHRTVVVRGLEVMCVTSCCPHVRDNTELNEGGLAECVCLVTLTLCVSYSLCR